MQDPFPDEYLVRIGKIGVAWGSLEALVDLCIGKLAGFAEHDVRSAIIAAHMSWPLKMDVLESLANALAPEFPRLAQFAKVRVLLKAAQDGRNRVSHGAWAYENGMLTKLKVSARGKLKVSVEPVTLDELDRTFSGIARAGTAILDLIANSGDYPGVVVTHDAP